MKNEYHTVIIGSGVAGMSAALNLKRANINCCIIEKDAPGGQINRTSTIDNYPGFLHIEGPELSMNIFEQIQNLGVVYKYGDVESIEIVENNKVVKTNLEEIICENIIIATGRTPRKLEVDGEAKYTNKGISWCAICDGPLYRNKRVAVIGGGRAAVEEAIYLSKICESVTLIHRNNTFRAEETLVEELKKVKNIEILLDRDVLNFSGTDEFLTTINIYNKQEKTEEALEMDGCFIYIGAVPNTAFITDNELLTKSKYILVNEKLKTTRDGIYACGDCVEKDLYQIVTAASEGAMVANQIITNKNVK